MKVKLVFLFTNKFVLFYM